jgi:3'(2'), 5'-bisphosphate nucleotidase
MHPFSGSARIPKPMKSLPKSRLDRITHTLELMACQAVGCEAFRDQVETIIKPDQSPVTVADLLHQAQFQQLMANRFPNDALISEEPRSLQEQVIDTAVTASRKFYGLDLDHELHRPPEQAELTWIMDPIDGTKGYLADRHYAIALACFDREEPFFAAMAVPASPAGYEDISINGSLAFAVKGLGTWLGKVKPGTPLEFHGLNIRDTEKPERLRLTMSLEHAGGLDVALNESLGEYDMVRMDSQAKYLAVAAGDLDVYLRRRRNDGHPDLIWDHLPGALIAQEAGCRVTHFSGKEIIFEVDRAVQFEGGIACCRPDVEIQLGDLVEDAFS